MSNKLIEESKISNNIPVLYDLLDICGQVTKEYLTKCLDASWSMAPYRSAQIGAFASKIKKGGEITGHFHKLSLIEQNVLPYIDKYTKRTDSLQEGSLGLIYFRGDNTKHLNFIPFFLAIWCTAKKYIFPALQILLPLIILIAPYLLLKYVFFMPLSFDNYFAILRKLYFGNMQFSFDNMFEFAKSIIHIAGIIIAMGQSVIQSVQHAMHLNTIETDIIAFGKYIRAYMQTYNEIRHYYSEHYDIRLTPTHIPDYSDRLTALWIIQYPNYFSSLYNIVGKVELQYKLALSIVRGVFHLPKWVRSLTPQLSIIGGHELSLQHKMKPISIHLTSHSILTGPNRGGKSTALRAILQNIILSHTLGIINADSAQFTPFYTVVSCLRLEDRPGTASLFEREIEWAVESLNAIPALPYQFALILVDELFHGTNPNDSLVASNIYLKRLWNTANALSVISTHQFNLIGNNAIQYFCCPATDKMDGTLEYTYELKKGVCRLSSVNDILLEKGLCAKSDIQNS